MAALTAAELQRRRELEGAPDPFPSLSAENAEVPSSRKASTRGPSPAGTNAALDTEDAEAFPALAPSSRNPSAPPSKPGTPAPGWGAGPPRIAPPVVRLFTDTFELDQVDLSTAGKDGKRAAGLSEVFRTVSAKHKVKCEASSQPSGYTSFTLKADTQKELERGRKLLISLISPLVTVTVDAPVSTIPAIIGPKGAFLNQIRDDTGAKIDIPRRDTAAIAASAGNNGKGNVVDSDDEEEETLSITITAAGAYAREAKRQIEEVISSRTAKVTKRVKDIPPHVLTFISARTAEFESLAPDNDVTVSIVGPDVHVSGHRGAVAEVIEAIKTSIDELNASITCIKMPMPKRQHRLLTGKAAEEILNKSKCSVQVPKADSDLEEIALWARPADLPGALAAVQQAANSQHIHSYKFPGKHAQALQIFTYLSRTGFSREVSKANPGISLHAPTAKDLQKESIVIDIVGDKAACEAAAKQVKEAADKLVGATRDVEIDWLLHRAIEGKYAKKIKAFKDTQRVTIFWPAENAESSKVLIVYEPTADQKDKAASLDEVQKELLKFAKEVADVKTEVIEVDEKWHSAIKGTNGTTLNALIGSESTLAIKLGTDAAKFVPAGQTATVQTIAVRGVVSDVTRAIADIHRIVEQAKNDEIDNSYTTEFQISQEYVGRIVGAQGAAVNRLREALGIEVDFTDEDDRGNKDYKDKDKEITVKRKKGGASGGAKARVTLKGRKENVEEAKKRILAQIERLEDETVEVLKIPRQYHSALIGRGAKYVRRLEDNYAVKVTFPRESDESGERTTREQLKADEVLIKGGKKGVADAKKELLDAVEYEKENNQQIKFTVPSRSVPRILGKSGANINEIKEDTGAQIDVDKAEDSSGNLTSISVRGTKEAIAEAKAAILKIVSEVGDEITETLQIPNHFHRTIIGSRGAGLQDILDRCGATDPRAQASLCRFPRQGDTSDEVVLRGPKTIVNKIVAELKKIVEGLSDRVVLGANIPAAQHKSLIGRGGQTLEALQTKHGVQVQFPGSRSYYGLGTLDNEDELNDVESENLVKVSGPKAACEAAIKDMQASAKSAPPERERSAQYSNTNASAVTETVEVPLKYHHAISQGGQFFRNLRNYGVNVDHSVAPPRGSAPARPTAGAASARIDADEADPSQPTWELAENHADADETISTWTLKGRDQEGIDKAKEALEEAIKNAQAISHVGFLTVPDRSVFPRIIGSKGATVQRLRADSGADITVGKDDNIITLQGSEAAVLKAKELILEIINRPARGPRRDRDRDYD